MHKERFLVNCLIFLYAFMQHVFDCRPLSKQFVPSSSYDNLDYKIGLLLKFVHEFTTIEVISFLDYPYNGKCTNGELVNSLTFVESKFVTMQLVSILDLKTFDRNHKDRRFPKYLPDKILLTNSRIHRYTTQSHTLFSFICGITDDIKDYEVDMSQVLDYYHVENDFDLVILWYIGSIVPTGILTKYSLQVPMLLATFEIVPNKFQVKGVVRHSFYFVCLSCHGAWLKIFHHKNLIGSGDIKAPLIKLPTDITWNTLKNMQKLLHSDLYLSIPQQITNTNLAKNSGTLELCIYDTSDQVHPSKQCLHDIFGKILNCTDKLRCHTVLSMTINKLTIPVALQLWDAHEIKYYELSAFGSSWAGFRHTTFLPKSTTVFSSGNSIIALLKPFKWEVWLLLIAVFIFITIFFFAATSQHTLAYTDMLFWSIENLLEQDYGVFKLQDIPTSFIIILTIWPLSGILLRDIYTSEVYSYITAPGVPELPSSITDVIARQDFDLVVTQKHYLTIFKKFRSLKGLHEKLVMLPNGFSKTISFLKCLSKFKPYALTNTMYEMENFLNNEFIKSGTKLVNMTRNLALTKFAIISSIGLTDNLPEMEQDGEEHISLEYAIATFANRNMYINHKSSPFFTSSSHWRFYKTFFTFALKTSLPYIVDSGILKTLESFYKINQIYGSIKQTSFYLNETMDSKFYVRLTNSRKLTVEVAGEYLRQGTVQDLKIVWTILILGWCLCCFIIVSEFLNNCLVTRKL